MMKVTCGHYGSVASPVPIYLAADTASAKKQFLDWDSDVRTMENEVYHFDRTSSSVLKDAQQAALDVFRDLKLLMDSTCIVMSRSDGRVSKFSRLADWLPTQPRCSAFWNDCGPEKVAEQLSRIKGRLQCSSREPPQASKQI
jgi:hypothetical protein